MAESTRDIVIRVEEKLDLLTPEIQQNTKFRSQAQAIIGALIFIAASIPFVSKWVWEQLIK